MSWLSAVTGKAEDLLNRLDKSAADAFHAEDESRQKQAASVKAAVLPSARTSTPAGGKPLTSSSSATNISAQLSDLARVGPSTGASTPKTPVSKPTERKKDSDEALFDFLNSKDPLEGNKKRVTPISSRHHSRQSSTSSVKGKEGEESAVGGDSGGGAEVASAQTSAAASTEPEQQSGSQRESPTNTNESADIEELADAMKESPTASEHSVQETDSQENRDTHLSALELENRLLKNEVDSLNQEMATLIDRAKKAQAEVERTKQKMAEHTSSAARQDQLLRELQSREMDMQEALNAKDSQLAVMRVQLEEADRRATTQHKEMEGLQSERERILQDQSSASGMHNQALDTMRQKLTEMEGTLQREQQAHKHYQQEASERQSRLELEQRTLAEALTSAEKKVTEEKAKAAEAYSQLKTIKASLESARQELVEYKEKATRILQSKERLITSLREGSGASGSAEGVSSLEYDSVRQERDMLREEIQRGKLTAESLRMELQDLELQLQQESNTAQDHIHSLEDSLSEEKRRREDAEQELLKQKQELQYAIDELHKQKVSYQTRITDREAEIEKLRNQLTTKSISSTSESELESRVRSLTESLIQKQTMLESLSTEKNSLTLQLERLGQQYRDVENSLMRSAAASVSVGDNDDDLRQRLPTFMKEGVADTEVTRRVKRYVNTIDKFSIRLGVFLRRYPMARIFVIIYMAMLHLWVMVVLMTYQPEIHGKDYLPTDHVGRE